MQSCCVCCASETPIDPMAGRREWLFVRCQRCGDFEIHLSAIDLIDDGKAHRGMFSGWLRAQVENKIQPSMDVDTVKSLVARGMPTFKERMAAYLVAAARRSPRLGEAFEFMAPELIGAAFCASSSELAAITSFLEGDGKLQVHEAKRPTIAVLTAQGHMAADELRAQHAASHQAFIAMWFDPQMEEARRRGLEEGIRRAGYRPYRVGDEHHNEKIDDRIIADIRRSRLLVADLTGHRGGVYFEAGFALGLSKPVFYTCRDDAMADIHFDVRQYNCIVWSDPENLANQLGARIEAVIGAGPEK